MPDKGNNHLSWPPVYTLDSASSCCYYTSLQRHSKFCYLQSKAAYTGISAGSILLCGQWQMRWQCSSANNFGGSHRHSIPSMYIRYFFCPVCFVQDIWSLSLWHPIIVGLWYVKKKKEKKEKRHGHKFKILHFLGVLVRSLFWVMCPWQTSCCFNNTIW